MTATVLSDIGQEHMSWMPRQLQHSIHTLATIDALAQESKNLLDQIDDYGQQMFVQTASWGLRLFEQTYGLQTWAYDDVLAPSDETRRVQILAKQRSNKAISGSEYRAVLDTYTTSYTIQMDHTTATLNFTIAFNGALDAADVLERNLRAITPAHLNVNFQYNAFLAGISAAGDAVY